MDFRAFLKSNVVYLDGSMGTMLQKAGLSPRELPERWNISHPERVIEIHKAYLDAGSNVVLTNTFGANMLKFSERELEEVVRCGVENARRAIELSSGKQEKFVALDIGPTGKLLKPLGDLDFENAVEIFKKTALLGEKYGADLIVIETINDLYEAKASLLAVKEATSLPVMISLAFGEDGRLLTGASADAVCATLEGLGADAIGANCSLGPRALTPVIERLLEISSVPVILKPNAGLPKIVSGKTEYDVSSEDFKKEILPLIKNGVRVVGGCCGTTPEYIRALCEVKICDTPLPITDKGRTVISSYTHTVEFGKAPVLIGERINPTGKKRFKEALIENDITYILNEAIAQEEKGASVLDVNVGIPEIDEAKMLSRAIFEIQSVVNLPLQIDTAKPEAMEMALRIYNGKPLINSVNGKRESMERIFPLAKKYGGVVIALTLDENGIPDTVEGRVDIAKNILKVAESYGIQRKDIIFDTLALTVSADKNAPSVTLGALEVIRRELSANTSLGVSNVSFGLPMRDTINATFFTLALARGLSAGIINPYSSEIMRAYYSYMALLGYDDSCKEYIKKCEEFAPLSQEKPRTVSQKSENSHSLLQNAIIKGLKLEAGKITEELLKSTAPLSIVNEEIIPALNTVGEGYERGVVYLPELLMSAEATKVAFEKIKTFMSDTSQKHTKARVLIATVHGDIHDIGKNIVKLLLENYGFDVIDLGRDVPSEKILSAVRENNVRLVFLSALMTTTVGAMEEAVRLIKEEMPEVKIMVGGAVLTQEYADKIGADAYGKDAMEAVRYAESLLG